MDTSIPYYEDRTRISNSNIGWFLQKGPAYLHKMLTDPPEEDKNYVLERGTMIHMYLLQPEEFQKSYVVWDKSRPSSAQQEKFCQALASSVEIEPDKAILSAYKESYSIVGKTDKTMLSEGLKIASTLNDYIDFLKQNDGRTMISIWDAKMLEKIKQNVQNHKLAYKLIYPLSTFGYEQDGTYTSGTINAWHEFHINWEYGQNTPTGDIHVACKSLLDSLTLNFKERKATIMDLKTTQKLWHFEDSIDMYDYCRQLCFYKKAVMWYLKNELEEDPDKWSFEYYIIGIDTTGSYEIRVFKLEDYMLNSRIPTIFNALYEIAWHQTTNNWDHSRSYYEGDGSEKLRL